MYKLPAKVRPCGAEDARGDEAANDDDVLHACHDHVDATGAEAAPRGGVIAGVGRSAFRDQKNL